MASVSANIVNEYKKKQSLYLELEKTAANKINREIEEKGFFVMEVSHRAKTVSSVARKLEKYKDRFHSILDFTDLVGIRIICYFADDVDVIAEAMQKLFTVCEIRDKRYKSLTEFGYASYHCICSLKNGEPFSEELCRIRFEIQIRTVLQHAWAEIEHDLGYKSSFGVPSIIRREFSRIAGLLETADSQFIGLRQKTGIYNERIKDAIREGNADALEVDAISLNEYICAGKFMKGYFEDLSEKHGIEITIVDASSYIELLEWLDITTLGKFKDLVRHSKEDVDAMICEQTGKYDLDIYASSAILQFMLESELARKEYSKPQLIKFFSLGKYDEKKAESRAEKILQRQKKKKEE